MTHTLTIFGEILSHKNEKAAVMARRRKDTAKGKAGTQYAKVVTKSVAKESMNRAAMQIPGELRDLKLQHPDLDVYFVVGRLNVDRDNILSSVLDLLVEYGVLADDNVAQFNGAVTLHPAMLRENGWETTILLKEGNYIVNSPAKGSDES